MTTITITHKTSVLELVAIFCLIPMLTIAKIARAVITAMQSVKLWLNTRHEFGFPEDIDDSVKLTGWQFLGFSLFTSILALILCIDWEYLF